ncbi:MAG: hypothetical protein Kow00121_00520 [Elainellaceae cyanobacterium]
MDSLPIAQGQWSIPSPHSLDLLDHVPLGECVLRRDGTVLFWNTWLEQWTNLSRAQIVGRKIDCYFPQFHQAKYAHCLRDVFEGGLSVTFLVDQLPYLIPGAHTNGQFKVQQTTITAIPAADGYGFDALVTVQDLSGVTAQANFNLSRIMPQSQYINECCSDRALLDAILSENLTAIAVTNRQGKIVFANPRAEEMLNLKRSNQLASSYKPPDWMITDADGNDLPEQGLPFAQMMQTGKPIFGIQRGIEWADGQFRFLSIDGVPLRHEGNVLTGFLFALHDITYQKQAMSALRERYEQERLVDRIIQHIHQSLNLQDILQTTVTEIQKLLKVDRVLIYQLHALQSSGRIVAESCNPNHPSILTGATQHSFNDLEPDDLANYLSIEAIADVTRSQLQPEYTQFLQRLGVKAQLILPIQLHNQHTTRNVNTWGWIIVQCCESTRQWLPEEIDLLKRLERQLAVAIHQSALHQQVQHLNLTLERKIHARTLELEQALTFESTLKRITDKVRDSLDENQILDTAVAELVKVLGVYYCDTVLYSLELPDTESNRDKLQRLDTLIRCHSVKGRTQDNLRGNVEVCTDREWQGVAAEIYARLFQGDSVAFCYLSSSEHQHQAVLVCPILDDQGILGDLWLSKLAASSFSQLEIRLVQQVANQCAIAIRQAQLYQAAQQKVEELARLNQLKDDFLSTISHELRTPIASILMALQTLERMIDPQTQSDNLAHAEQYFHILEDECHREVKLIDDLLDLTHLDAGTEPLLLVPIHLEHWLPYIADTFEPRFQEYQQTFRLDIPKDLPPLITDLTILERILVELLTNACKYTPAGETIAISAQPGPSPPDSLETAIHVTTYPTLTPICAFTKSCQIRVSNTGIEIPVEECQRVFDKFYRIPNSDPWKHGGTGLGLALAKRMVEYLGGNIWVESQPNLTCFVLELAIAE